MITEKNALNWLDNNRPTKIVYSTSGSVTLVIQSLSYIITITRNDLRSAVEIARAIKDSEYTEIWDVYYKNCDKYDLEYNVGVTLDFAP